MKPLTIFTFGYWGWGNSTKQLLKATSRVEESEKLEPPLLVDIRISRSGRAVGFHAAAFKNPIWRNRYLWMSKLGNRSVQTGEGRINIKNPHAAEDLLCVALENHEKANRRIIFFCSCKLPGSEWHQDNCHRVTVASLLLKCAARREHAIEIVEWPGGEPTTIELDLTTAETEKIAGGTKSIPVKGNLPSPDLLSLAWGSVCSVGKDDHAFPAIVGPARFEGGAWFLPLPCGVADVNESFESAQRRAAHWRHRYGFEPRRSDS